MGEEGTGAGSDVARPKGKIGTVLIKKQDWRLRNVHRLQREHARFSRGAAVPGVSGRARLIEGLSRAGKRRKARRFRCFDSVTPTTRDDATMRPGAVLIAPPISAHAPRSSAGGVRLRATPATSTRHGRLPPRVERAERGGQGERHTCPINNSFAPLL